MGNLTKNAKTLINHKKPEGLTVKIILILAVSLQLIVNIIEISNGRDVNKVKNNVSLA